ncbi:hypothetical protein BD779DRAFT_167670 [Infundibulicybe gibba]|nr:hypothetical protein BD779DRAFT_167670 [Infundibulicybe gibba]
MMSDFPDKIASHDLNHTPPHPDMEHQNERDDSDEISTANDAVDEFEVQICTTQGDGRPNHREKALAARALKRSERSRANELLAAEHSQSGDERLESGDHPNAIVCYTTATKICNTNPLYYLKLAQACFEMQSYGIAEANATTALTLDPASVEPRFLRGLIRMEQRILGGAQIDFNTVLSLEKEHPEARNSLETLSILIKASSKLGVHNISEEKAEQDDPTTDYTFPVPNSDKLELASRSDSSDCNHTGNGTPCRFYNHDGCLRGAKCGFSHAPDEKSVRDDLGQNVCLYYLLGSCKFGDAKCIYSHNKDCLPKRGWWADVEQTAKVKAVLELAEQQAREQRALESLLYKLNSQTRKPRSKSGKGQRSDRHPAKGNPQPPASTTVKPPAAAESMSHFKSNDRKGRKKYLDYDSTGSYDDLLEQRMMNGGFTDYELNDLLCQGVKPWDDNAWDVLAALSY